jgi:GH24 family phage-related lysozyme (muramidase)
MSKKKLLDYLKELILENPPNWQLMNTIDPRTGKPINPSGKEDIKNQYGVDLTSGDYLEATSDTIGIEVKPTLGTSTVFPTSCTAPLYEQIREIILGSEGFLDHLQWDEDSYRAGYGSMTYTYEDNTFEYYPNSRPEGHGGEQYCTHPEGTNKKGIAWKDLKLSKEDADRDFNRSIDDNFIKGLKNSLGETEWNKAPDCVKAIMVSLAYNCGVGGATQSVVKTPFKEGDYCKVADVMETICTQGAVSGVDLLPRRQKEAKWIRECYCSVVSNATSVIQIDPTKENIIIGDSACTFIDWGSELAARLNGSTQGPEYLWSGGTAMGWLKSALSSYPINTSVKNVIISNGTNSAFSKYDDISGLMTLIKTKLPNAKVIVVPGAWNVKGTGVYAGKILIPYDKNAVDSYYKKFTDLGASLTTPIGDAHVCCKGDLHGNYPIYKTIGSEIDSFINKNNSK